MLEAAELEVGVVGNGEETVAAVRDSPPDLVLMDVQMPGTDGPEPPAACARRAWTRP